MKNGLQLFIALICFVLITASQGTIEWIVQNSLDEQIKPESTLNKTISTFANYQLLTLGISIGILSSLLIGYWKIILSNAAYYLKVAKAFLQTMRESAIKERKISTGIVRLMPDETSVDVTVSEETDPLFMRVEYEPRDSVISTDIIRGKISFIRRKHSNSKPEILISYSVWGRTIFLREFSRKKRLIDWQREKEQGPKN